MRPRKSSVSFRPSGPDSSPEVERLFASAGSDVEGIETSSASEAVAELDAICGRISSKNEWDDQVSAMRRGMALINGGALEYDSFVRSLVKLHDGVASAASNLRSALVKASCLFIAMMARELGSEFEVCGDYITPLAPQLSNGTHIIANCCKCAILQIAKHCPSRRILATIIDLCNARGPCQKAVAAEALSIILATWPAEAIGTNWPRLMVALQKLIGDASPNVRVFARRSAKALQIISPQKSKEFLSKLDQRTRKAISEEMDTAIEPPVFERTRKRAPSAQPTSKKFKSVSQMKIRHNDSSFDESHAIKTDDMNKSPQKQSFRADNKDRDVIRSPNRNKGRFNNPNLRPSTAVKSKKKQNEIAIRSNDPHEEQFELIEGQERVFIGIVKEYLDDGNSRELAPHMKEIALNILKCCSSDTPAISVSALAVLHDAILLFPQHFEPNLPLVVNVLLDRTVYGCPRAISNAEIILQELSQHFDANELIKLLANAKPSLSLLHFIANLAEQSSVDFDDQSVCFSLISNAARCIAERTEKNFSGNNNSSTEQRSLKSQQIAARVVGRVFVENEDAFNAFTDTLNQAELNSLQSFVKPYFPTIEFHQSVIDVPQYSTKSAKESLREIQKVIESAEDGREWTSARPRIYAELNHAMMQKAEVDTALIIAQKTLHLRGFEDFERMFPGIMLNARGPYSRIAEISLTMILHGVELETLLKAIQPNIKCDNIVIAKNSIDYQTKIISTVSKLSLKPYIPILIPTLCESLKNKAPEIRKATVLCYVELCVVMGNEMDQYIKQLEKPQQKLITIFLSRRTGK